MSDVEKLVEAIRQEIIKLPRYSFLLDASGGVRRYKDSVGRWVELDEVTGVLDLERVDALLAQADALIAINKAKGGIE